MAAAVTALNCPVRIFLKYSEPAAPEAVCANYSARLKIAGKVAGVDRPVAVSELLTPDGPQPMSVILPWGFGPDDLPQ